jgi:cytochrome P450
MKKTIVYRLLRRIYRTLLKTKHKNEINKLIFVYGGRAEGWPGLGRSLYVDDRVFADNIRYINTFLTKNGGTEILSYFEGPIDKHYFDEDESKFICIIALQLAATKLQNERGHFPNAVMGISLGELTAAYAAGVLTIEEVLTILIGYSIVPKAEAKSYSIGYLNLAFKGAREFCKKSPVYTEIIFEDNPQAVLITFLTKDAEQLKEFISSHNLSFRLVSDKSFVGYHTSVMKKHYYLLEDHFSEFAPRPLKCDFYSPTLGKVIPKNCFLPADYWYTLPHSPVLFSTTLQAALNDGFNNFLTIGPLAISSRQFNNMGSYPGINAMNLFKNGTDEIIHYQHIDKILTTLKAETNTAFIEDDGLLTLKEFANQFNIYSEGSLSGLQYLRKSGPVHFLPVHNFWAVLGYDEVDAVLKQPELYSSSLLKEYDPILLGADPEAHKVISDMLYPFFSPKVIAELSEFTTIIAEYLLEPLLKKDCFDIVKDYSDPLSILVLCNFFGLSSAEADKMLNFTGTNYNEPLYWQRLEEYFREQFNLCNPIRADRLWAKLRILVHEGQFKLADAVSLMKIIWTAGIATSSALISAAINTALNEPAIAGNIYTDRKLAAKFIEECLRQQTPLTAVYRLTTQPVELAGQQIPANTPIMLHLRTAMADPQQFENPGTFSVTRPAKRHLAFGSGIHQCIGMGIARAEATSALMVVLQKFTDLSGYYLGEPQYLRSVDLQPMTSLVLSK